MLTEEVEIVSRRVLDLTDVELMRDEVADPLLELLVFVTDVASSCVSVILRHAEYRILRRKIYTYWN